ncbi:alpha-hydroxy acid oxidase [Paenirhodobacter populi]|uniref:alpha-hydroxy acid oxidase n=1 Tax=Paenirhodobacter populi TaxID=2306993 RepID=UPI001F4D6CF7|nr:alpha-hydroxy acid oxidase [Sinirhodobacter populi]
MLTAGDYREAARGRLPRAVFEYIDRGTEGEQALCALRASLDGLRFMPRMLTGHAERDLTAQVMGQSAAMPVVIAPTALAGLVSHDGEVKMARAAARMGIPACVSTQSITPIEAIRAGAPEARLWFQLYAWKDRALTRRLLERVAETGVSTLVLTVDTPVVPLRDYNQRNGFGMPLRLRPRLMADMARHPRWLVGVMLRYLLAGGMPTYGHYPPEFRTSITRPAAAAPVRLENLLNWDDVRDLRRWWKGELIVKGIFSLDDARICHNLGADGIVVSSHGGRNIDSAPPPAELLPAIVGALGDRIEIFADSGVMRGSDVLKYLSLGARGVMTGRLPLWGLASGGEAGAVAVLEMIRNEMDVILALLGARSPSDVSLA